MLSLAQALQQRTHINTAICSSLRICEKVTLTNRFVKRKKKEYETGQRQLQVSSPIILAGEDHRFQAFEQLREVGIDLGCVILAQRGRNTVPALTLAALAAMDGEADPVQAVKQHALLKANGFAVNVTSNKRYLWLRLI